MKAALARGADLVLQMDADFSHDPSCLPQLAAKAQDYDLVIGSRYCPGGRIEGWARRRRVLSRCANFYVRQVIGLRTLDNTGAFRCWRAEALARIALDSLKSDGYAFIVEMAYMAHCLGLRIAEIPIVFVERREGQSKLSRRVILESVVMPWRLVLSGGRAAPAAGRDGASAARG
jgi:dolichol-phosphate mannosyltransferase